MLPDWPALLASEVDQATRDKIDATQRRLAEANRRTWLHAKPETNGAQQVERHGLTPNQRAWLNEIRDGYESAA